MTDKLEGDVAPPDDSPRTPTSPPDADLEMAIRMSLEGTSRPRKVSPADETLPPAVARRFLPQLGEGLHGPAEDNISALLRSLEPLQLEESNNALLVEEMKAMPVADCTSILDLLFGADPCMEFDDVRRWFEHPLELGSCGGYSGLVQLHGGPCGVLAPLNAFMMRWLLYCVDTTGEFPTEADAPSLTTRAHRTARRLAPSSREAWTGLFQALLSVLYSAALERRYEVVRLEVASSSECVSNPRQILKNCTAFRKRFHHIGDVAGFWRRHFTSFFRGPTGAVSFVASVLATRTTHQIREDVDDPTASLIGRFGDCSQELVNLMLTGTAASNTFDGFKTLGIDEDTKEEMRLRGIETDCIIGQLSEHEAARLCEVGFRAKHPLVPIWVVSGASHYTILFCLDPQLAYEPEGRRKMQDVLAAFDERDTAQRGFLSLCDVKAVLRDAMQCDGKQLDAALRELRSFDRDDTILRSTLEGWLGGRIESKQTDETIATAFAVYHYDGQVPPGPTLRRFQLSLAPGEVSPAVGVPACMELSRILQTRWPGCACYET